jgi:pimeloyl-ACP methyl ester carboxylesterase
MQRQTPALLADAVKELKARLPVDRVYLGGHSQGGFLTYITFLYYPELFDGAFPMSCNLLVQCEPTWFKKEAIEKQRRIAVAPIHGRADSTVPFSSGHYAAQRMEELGLPRLHFFAADKVGHPFMALPVEPAIRWLDAMTSPDPAALLDHAEQQLAAGEWRDASGAAQRARSLDKGGALAARAEAVERAVDAACAPDAERLATAIARTKDNSWVDDFWEFRRKFGCTPGARKCLDAYERLHDKHTKPADTLWAAARSAPDAETRKAKQREIAEKYYGSSWWILVRDSLK